MYLRNCVSAVMGLWFILSPWVFGFGDMINALYACLLLGGLQFVSAMLALGKSGKYVWQNWVCIGTGALCIIVPNVFHLGLLPFSSFLFFGFMTVLVNYANLYPEDI